MSSETRETGTGLSEPLAIIGMACLFPKADGLGAYWANIRNRVDCIADLPPTHWSAEDYFDSNPKTPDRTYCRRGGFLSPVRFDPGEFGISPNTLEAIDTSQLLALVVAREALRDAGYDPQTEFDRKRVSVILGVTGTLELVIPLGARLGHPIWRRALREAGVEGTVAEDVVRRIGDSYVEWQESSFPGLLGNVVAGRIANRFDLGGTNCAVDAACASSLSAAHLSMLELAAGRSKMVVTGGVDAFNDIFMFMCFSKTPALSPGGNSRPFDAAADGTIIGEGIGMVVLKRLSDAEADGNRIYALLTAIGTSSDGRGKSIYAPDAEGQKKAIQDAYRLAGIGPDQVEMVEAHGTGTKVGDAVEASALIDVFRSAGGPRPPWCALGSVKSQIGHTKAAAGVAGLIKAALALHHKVIPPTIKVSEPLPLLTEPGCPIYLSTEARPWMRRPGLRRHAGVSSFGFGGSNFHAVLTEHRPQKAPPTWDGVVQIVPVGGPDPAAVTARLDALAKLDSWDRIRVEAADLRQSFDARQPVRAVLVVTGDTSDLGKLCAEAAERLNSPEATGSQGSFVGTGPSGPLAMLFAGQGSQYVHMGRDLACVFPEMHEALVGADEAFAGATGAAATDRRLSDSIYPVPAWSEADREAQEATLRATEVAQPALGAVGLGMLGVLRRFAVRPDLVAGHSYGELAALCAAGRLPEGELHRLSRRRGELMAGGPGERGGMLAVKAPASQLEQIVAEERLQVVLANRNAPDQNVLAGAMVEIERAAGILSGRGIRSVKLPVAAAFHSPLVAGAQGPFRATLEPVEFGPGRIPVWANATAEPYPDDPAGVRELLAGQLARPVEFVRMIEGMHAAGARTFLEVGPGARLTGLVGSILRDRPHRALACDASGGKRSGLVDLARALARLAALGHPVDLRPWEGGTEAVRQLANRAAPRLSVMLSGANYRSPAKTARTPVGPALAAGRPAPRQPSDAPTAQINSLRVERPNSPAAARPAGSKPMSQETADPKTKTVTPRAPDAPRTGVVATPSNPLLSEALRASQESLAALARHQEQVAQLHQQFLQGQETAQRTFHSLVEHQQSLFLHATGLPATSVVPIAPPEERPAATGPVLAPVPIPEPARPRAAALAPQPAAPVPVTRPAAPAPTPPAPPSVPARGPAAARTPSAAPAADVAATVRKAVSEKTGYPPEMLKLEMDLEADLGIDSIKRVEIFSSVQELLPGAPVVKPDHMGTLKTLGQVVEFLGSAGPRADTTAASAATAGPAAPAAPAVQTGGIEATQVSAVLLAIVAEKTGYPPEMLKVEMDMEADLGIDSIKRVEILSAIQEKLPEAPVVKPDQMGTLKTLGDILDFLSAGAADPSGSRPAAPTAPAPEGCSRPLAVSPVPVGLVRQVLRTVPLDQATLRRALPFSPDNLIWVADGGSGLGAALVEKLTQRGLKSKLTSTRELAHPGNGAPVGGLVIVAARRTTDPDGLWGAESERFLKEAFQVAQLAGASLCQEGQARGAFLATVSWLDGAFGTGGLADHQDPLSGALAGLAKTAAREWPQVNARALDVSFGWTDMPAVAEAVCRELLVEGPMEVGLSPEGAVALTLCEQPLLKGCEGPDLLERGEVVLVTGGARGVTAEVAVELARQFGSTLALLGRTRPPEPEPEAFRSLADEAAIKRAILGTAGQGPLSPRELETRYRQLVANREVRATLDRIEEAGGRAVYCTVDVRDAQALARTVAAIRRDHGPIRGLIHGAGVLADRHLADKTLEQFESVFDTKVVGLRALLSELRSEELKVLVMFSSVSARHGRTGQVDYAMANEVLNKVARSQAALRPACRVLSIGWGPWDGGMVTPALKRVFVQEGVGVIGLADGAAHLVAELAAPRGDEIETVVTGPVAQERPESRPPSAARPLELAFQRRIDLERHPFLLSHVLKGRPVLPLAMTAEWLAHAAMTANPGLLFHGVDELRVLKGIVVEDQSTDVQAMVGTAQKEGALYRVPVELRSADARGAALASAVVLLATRLPPPNGASEPLQLGPAREYPCSVDEAYETLLFHGPALRAIERIDQCTAAGLSALVRGAPPPDRWMKEPLRDSWLADPLVLDAAFQLMILWTFDQEGSGCLPCHVKRYRQYRTGFPQDPVRVLIRVAGHRGSLFEATVLFTDAHDALIARMDGFEATVDPHLKDAFARRVLTQGARPPAPTA